jgi:hypothetical protein
LFNNPGALAARASLLPRVLQDLRRSPGGVLLGCLRLPRARAAIVLFIADLALVLMPWGLAEPE